MHPPDSDEADRSGNCVGHVIFQVLKVGLIPQCWFWDCKSPPHPKAKWMHLGNRRNSIAGSQALDFSHTLGFKSSSYQLHIPFQTTDNIPEWNQEFEKHCIRTCSISTFLFYFYLTFKRHFLLLSNPKRKKTRFGVPPFSLLPPCMHGCIEGLFTPLEENWLLVGKSLD